MTNNTHKLLVFGSRDIDNDTAEKILADHLATLSDVTLLTAADPSGACEVARNYARSHAIPLTLFFLNAKQNGRGKYHWRSVEALRACTSALFIYDGTSKGTRNEIALAEKMHVPYTLQQCAAKPDDVFGWEQSAFDWDVTN